MPRKYPREFRDDVVRVARPGAGLQTHSYDNAGSHTSWTRPAGTEALTWDKAGNRLSDGSATPFVYDDRNRLISGPEGSYEYTAWGALAEFQDANTVGADVYDFDSLGRLVQSRQRLERCGCQLHL